MVVIGLDGTAGVVGTTGVPGIDCEPDGTTIIVHVSEHSEGVKVPGIVWELSVGTVSVVVWGYV